MKRVRIKIKNYESRAGVINYGEMERRILKILLFSFGFLAILYILFMGSMVFNIVARRNLEVSIRVLSNEVVSLESSYLSMNSKIDFDFSKSLGFNEVKTTFVTRKPLGYNIDFGQNFGNIKIGKNEI